MASPSKRDSFKERAPDALTTEEVTGEHDSTSTSTENCTGSTKRANAFTELMSSKKSKSNSLSMVPTETRGALLKATKVLKSSDPRNGLSVYIENPETNPEGKVVEYDNKFVVIKDKYPKASVHLLLIPRDPEHYTQHPLRALSTDAAFLTSVSRRIDRLKRLAASELRRQYGQLSASDTPYQIALQAMMNSPDSPSTHAERDVSLPSGRDWLSEIVAGVHTHPSMNHLHVHVFSQDMQSPWMKHKKHYLSFNTSFLVKLDEFPLKQESARFHPGDWPNWPLVCWRCGQNFDNKFKALKEHLRDEFEQWKLE